MRGKEGGREKGLTERKRERMLAIETKLNVCVIKVHCCVNDTEYGIYGTISGITLLI